MQLTIEKGLAPVLLDIEFKQDTLLVRPGGELDLSVADFLRNNLEESLDREPARNIVLNLSKVSFVDSSVLGVFLGRYKRVSKNGGRVIIVSPQPQVRRILELSGLFRIMGESDSEAEALRKLG
ncbi:Anti-sigma F factor antagonist [Pelotomaculum schinkii]|uniref:Anti-sigma F factor antagonist n=1 Tax=Pelotomaculum schinkii TaxID=78350 RepID=A0A4Y7RCK1_9FIRM|nr:MULTISPECIES: anti-sigma F factor antagonist [Pelotomaculum]TEB06704.1 Anti-sigma F factor antagonist [Pelotomaculum schinkii]TEB17488.1 Anti-sigma F factor antagonist [Pelotomaculum sp. FP]